MKAVRVVRGSRLIGWVGCMVIAACGCARAPEPVEEGAVSTTDRGAGFVVESSRAHKQGNGIRVRVRWRVTNTSKAPMQVSTGGTFIVDRAGRRFASGARNEGGATLGPGETYGPVVSSYDLLDTTDASGLIWGPVRRASSKEPGTLAAAVRLNVQSLVTDCDRLRTVCDHSKGWTNYSACNRSLPEDLEARERVCAERVKRVHVPKELN